MLSTESGRIKSQNPVLNTESKLAALNRASERVERSLARARGKKRRQHLEQRIANLTVLRERVAGREVA